MEMVEQSNNSSDSLMLTTQVKLNQLPQVGQPYKVIRN